MPNPSYPFFSLPMPPAKIPHISSSALPSLSTYKSHSNLMATRIPPRMEKLPPITCHSVPLGPLGSAASSSSSSGKRRQLGLRSRWSRSVPPPKIAASLQRSVAVDSSLSHPSGGEEGEEDEVGSKSAEEERHGVQRYLVAVEYDGSRFSGSQWQPSRRTVVGVLQDAFQNFIGQPVPVFCSSRTDAGVHALSNVCHADVERISKRRPGEVLPPHDPGVVKKAVNHFLQKNEGDIRVIDVQSVPANFHARFNAQKRTYFYRLLSGPGALSLFESGRAWHVSDELDILSMQKACGILVGYHDFSSFRATRCQAKSPIKTLDELHVSEVGSYFPLSTEREHESFIEEQLIGDATVSGLPCDHSYGVHTEVGMPNNKDGQKFGVRKRHRCFIITATARSFLYHQVRILVGVLKSVGTGDLSVNDVERILNARTVTTCQMAPACGLYLGHVKYDLP